MRKEDIGGFILLGIICFGLIFWIIIMPIAMAYGIISGKIDIETLEPVSVQEQIVDSTMEQGGFGGY